MSITNKKIAIIGAGIAGLTIANKLFEANEVTIFDKSRGIGGRMATRRHENYHFDHGAQFFRAKTSEFKQFCIKAAKNNVISQWQGEFAEITANKITRNWPFSLKNPHYVGQPQMNSLCKYMARDLNVILNQRISEINFKNNKWSLSNIEGQVFDNFDYLILAIPSDQAVDLLPDNFKYFNIVKNIKMLPCFTLMLGFENDLDLDFDAALVKESIISWIALNNSKNDRPKSCALVVNSSNEWAKQNLEQDLEFVTEKILQNLAKIIHFDINDIKYKSLQRWRYANASLRNEEKSLFDPNLNLGICGDWLISGRVENAFLSGLDLFNKL